MEGLSGIDTGREIRQEFCGYNTEIVYVTAVESYAKELFQFQPFGFLVKPVKNDELAKLFKNLIGKIQEGRNLFHYGCKRGQYTIATRDICYLSSDNKTITIVPIEKARNIPEEREYRGKLSEAIELLPTLDFIRIHQSYIVNCNYIVKFGKINGMDSVAMTDGQILEVSRAYKEDVKRIFMKRSGAKKEKHMEKRQELYLP